MKTWYKQMASEVNMDCTSEDGLYNRRKKDASVSNVIDQSQEVRGKTRVACKMQQLDQIII